jgi:predicted ester cyclase
MTSFKKELFAASPDLHATTLESSPTASGVGSWSKVRTGSLFGFPPTGRAVRWDEIDTYRVANGKVTEEWSSPDMTNILHQIGAYTPPWIA